MTSKTYIRLVRTITDHYEMVQTSSSHLDYVERDIHPSHRVCMTQGSKVEIVEDFREATISEACAYEVLLAK